MEINLDSIRHNLACIRDCAGPDTGIIAVVKDNAYGCGAVSISRALVEGGVTWFAVARPEEAKVLRSAGIGAPILVLGEAGRDDLAWGAAENVRFSVNDIETLADWVQSGAHATIHIHVDTGMNRVGLTADEVPIAAALIAGAPGITCEGVYTHLACADSTDTKPSQQQLAAFESALRAIRQHGLAPAMIHAENSAATLYLPRNSSLTHIRPGIMLYGCSPDPSRTCPAPIRPVAALSGPVVAVRELDEHTPVSYGWHYRAPGRTAVATVALGYAHGVPRALSTTGKMLLNGRLCPIAGTVTMDYCMVDIGSVKNACPGDRAFLFGGQGETAQTVDDVARAAGTIGYELLCRMSRSIDRIYTTNGIETMRVRSNLF